MQRRDTRDETRGTRHEGRDTTVLNIHFQIWTEPHSLTPQSPTPQSPTLQSLPQPHHDNCGCVQVFALPLFGSSCGVVVASIDVMRRMAVAGMHMVQPLPSWLVASGSRKNGFVPAETQDWLVQAVLVRPDEALFLGKDSFGNRRMAVAHDQSSESIAVPAAHSCSSQPCCNKQLVLTTIVVMVGHCMPYGAVPRYSNSMV